MLGGSRITPQRWQSGQVTGIKTFHKKRRRAMTTPSMRQHRPTYTLRRRAAYPATLAILLAGIHGSSNAVEIDTGNPDVSVRWDNTVRYNLGVRAQQQD